MVQQDFQMENQIVKNASLRFANYIAQNHFHTKKLIIHYQKDMIVEILLIGMMELIQEFIEI